MSNKSNSKNDARDMGEGPAVKYSNTHIVTLGLATLAVVGFCVLAFLDAPGEAHTALAGIFATITANRKTRKSAVLALGLTTIGCIGIVGLVASDAQTGMYLTLAGVLAAVIAISRPSDMGGDHSTNSDKPDGPVNIEAITATSLSKDVSNERP